MAGAGRDRADWNTITDVRDSRVAALKRRRKFVALDCLTENLHQRSEIVTLKR